MTSVEQAQQAQLQQVPQQPPALQLQVELERSKDISEGDQQARERARHPEQAILTGVANNVVRILERVGISYGQDGQVSVTDKVEPKEATRASRSRATERQTVLGQTAVLGPARAPTVAWSSEIAQGARAFANNIDHAGTGLAEALSASQTEKDLARMRDMSADLLLAIFLKLNITDPNNSVETHAKLIDVMSELRQLAIAEAKKRIERAQELMKEAESSGGYMDSFGIIMQVIGAIASIFTMGAAAAATAAAQTAMQTAQQALQQTMQQMMQQLTQQLSQMTQQQMTQLLQSMTQEQLQQLAQQMAQQLPKELAQNLTQNLASMTKEQLVQTLADPALRDALTQAVEQQLSQITNQVAQQTADYAAQLQASGMPPAEMQQAIQEFYQKALVNGIQQQLGSGFLENSVIKEMIAKLPEQFAKEFITSFQTALQTQTPGQVTQSTVERLKQDPMSLFKMPKSDSMAALQKVAVVGKAASDVGKAQAEAEAAAKAAAAAEQLNNAKRFRLIAEMAQQQIEAENEIIRMIMESKNQAVDAVIKMLNAMFSSSVQLMSANAWR
ncbi:MAG: hypothetical protein HY903_07330 [Deltaproteobacteria bacterium]|nr:hypothetical protein [Deltaproteobacteria bacterium]